MLKGIPPVISPDLMTVLMEMGHGDEQSKQAYAVVATSERALYANIILKKGVLGILFIGFLASHLVMIRGLTDGAGWLMILTAITAGTDTGAYWIGCRWGKRKLCPSISPNKTVEGGAGGVAGAVIAGLIMYSLLDVQSSVLMVLVLALLLSVAGMVGDLLESIIKRGTGTKDSGTILAGHGGILDRLDSLLFAGPFLYYILVYLHA